MTDEPTSGAKPEAGHDGPRVDPRLLELLVCPLTKTRLEYDAQRQELVSRAAGLAFPIRNGVPLMTLDAARPIDSDPRRPDNSASHG
jgi:uncharacterized protein YbaR (Trm112 family)